MFADRKSSEHINFYKLKNRIEKWRISDVNFAGSILFFHSLNANDEENWENKQH